MLDKYITTLTVDSVGFRKIECFDNGRWGLSKEWDLIDYDNNTVYTRDSTIPLYQSVYENITGLTNDGPVSIAWLYALLVKPQYTDYTKLSDLTTGAKIYIREGSFNGNPEQLFWQYPDGGISYGVHPFNTDQDSLYIPGATRYLLAGNRVYGLTDEQEVTAGTNRDNKILITLDVGVEVEVEIARLMLLANGKYDYRNWNNDIIYLDGDMTNLTLSNLSLAPTEVTGNNTLVSGGLPRELTE